VTDKEKLEGDDAPVFGFKEHSMARSEGYQMLQRVTAMLDVTRTQYVQSPYICVSFGKAPKVQPDLVE